MFSSVPILLGWFDALIWRTTNESREPFPATLELQQCKVNRPGYFQSPNVPTRGSFLRIPIFTTTLKHFDTVYLFEMSNLGFSHLCNYYYSVAAFVVNQSRLSSGVFYVVMYTARVVP